MYYLGSNGVLYYTSQDDYETCEDLGFDCEYDEFDDVCIHCGMPA